MQHLQQTRGRICPRGAVHRCTPLGALSPIRLACSQHGYYFPINRGVLQAMQVGDRVGPWCMQAVRDGAY